MKNYKENFENALKFAVEKATNKHWKLILLGIMGVVYVAIAYVAFIFVIGSWNGVVELPEYNEDGLLIKDGHVEISGAALITAAAIFPVGLLLIIFLGGSLFTSDNLSSIAVITKQVKLKPVILKWMLTLLGNVIGSIIIAAIIRAGNIFSDERYQVLLGYLSGKKINLSWYYTLFSGLLCNILVAGTVWASLASSHSSAKIFLIYFPIWLFAVVGFQHIVANGIIFSMTGFYMINSDEYSNVAMGLNYAINHSMISPYNTNLDSSITPIDPKDWINGAKFLFGAIFINMIPAGIGNWFSGAIILPYTYYWLSSWKWKSKTMELNLTKHHDGHNKKDENENNDSHH